MLLPIKHLLKGISFLSNNKLTNVIRQGEVNAPPLNHFYFLVFGYQSNDFFAKLGNSEICVSTKDLSKGLFVVRSFVVDGIQGKV